MTRHAIVKAEAKDMIALTIHNKGLQPRTVHKTRAGAILTLHYWGAKDATKIVDAAIGGEEQRVAL
jgi:hypothetical protein